MQQIPVPHKLQANRRLRWIKPPRTGPNSLQRWSPIGRVVLAFAALPFLLAVSSAAEPLSDAQMDNLTVGRRAIVAPLTRGNKEVWWVAPDGAAPPFYWYGGHGWQSFLVTSLGSAAVGGQSPALIRPSKPPGIALHR
jgi:hypothetical protein